MPDDAANKACDAARHIAGAAHIEVSKVVFAEVRWGLAIVAFVAVTVVAAMVAASSTSQSKGKPDRLFNLQACWADATTMCKSPDTTVDMVCCTALQVRLRS